MSEITPPAGAEGLPADDSPSPRPPAEQDCPEPSSQPQPQESVAAQDEAMPVPWQMPQEPADLAPPAAGPSEQAVVAAEPSEQQPAAQPAAEAPSEQAVLAEGPAVVVRYGVMHHLGRFSHNLGSPPPPGAKVVVRTERGVELGEVVAGICKEGCSLCISARDLAGFIEASGPDYPFRTEGKVLRLANHQDVVDHRHLEGSAREEAAFCRQQIREMGLKMRVVTVEHLLGGERIIFYFSAESRVDFREMVRRLAGQYRTRIEMRQVGARDEAKLVGDYERCGRQCCCQSFLKTLKPVSMRMAKTQKATLDPTKISGRCGRLMCCLRYEDAGYEELRLKLPRRNTWVRTADLLGRVVETHILTQMVRLGLPDNTLATVGNEEIIERDVPAPPRPEMPEPSERRPTRDDSQRRLLRDTLASGQAEVEPPPKGPDEDLAEEVSAGRQEQQADREAQDLAAEDAGLGQADQTPPGQGEPRRRRRRRSRRKGRGEGDRGRQFPPQPVAQSSPTTGRPDRPQQQSGQAEGGSRRRRRRRRGRGPGPQQGNQPRPGPAGE